MMMDIFSSFDYTEFSSILFFPAFFTALIMLITMLTSSFWMSPTHYWKPIWNFMHTESQRTTGKHLTGTTVLTTITFMMFISLNLSGLIPYSFSLTSHLLMTLSIGLPLWFSLILSSAENSPKQFIAHFLPEGGPWWLNPFLILVETVSILVRPLTLSFRLAANMSAGHILLSIIGIFFSSTMFLKFSSSAIILAISTLYLLFEVGICIIQAYIFCLLISLYSDDHSH